MALTTSVKAVTDIFRIYGTKIFGGTEDGNEESTNNTTNQVNTTKRRLYRSDDEENSLNDLNRFHFESVIEIMLDMLDDEVKCNFFDIFVHLSMYCTNVFPQLISLMPKKFTSFFLIILI